MKKKITLIISMVAAFLVMIPGISFADTNYFEVDINGVKTQYPTSGSAFDAVKNVDSATIKLLDNYTGPGLIVSGSGNKNITFDLNGYTWEVTDPLVGSPGTETNAFQLLSGNTVTFKDGTVKSSVARILFQNYCDLTLDNVDVELTTPGTGNYASSNNNGTTLIKGGSTITVSGNNMALDSFNFGSYTGGNVIVEDATINGNLELANGGALELDGGTINGNVEVYNYSYDSHVGDISVLTISSGTINGDVSTSEKGKTVIEGGKIVGEVTLDNSNGAEVLISGGEFENDVTQYVENGKVSVKYTSGNNTTYYVGTQAQINEIVKAAGAGDKIDVLQGDIALDIPTADVQITNSGTGEISVNGETVIAGETIMIKGQASTQPSTTTPADKATAASNDKAVATGDDFNMTALLAIMGVAAAAAAGTVVYGRRKRSN